MRIGCIGVGLTGGALARNLIRAGKQVLVYDRSPKAVNQTLAAGTTARGATCLADFADRNVVFTRLPLPREVKNVLLGPDGLLARLKPGAIVIDLSTIDPQTAITLEAAAKAGGCRFLQCSLDNTPAQAEKAEEPLFVGGDKAAFDELAVLWPIIGSSASYMGTVEAACAMRLISTLVGMTNLAALAEGIRIGEKAGIGRKTLIRLLQGTGARSFQMDERGPWIADDDFANRFGLDQALKEVRLGCEMAEAWGMKIPTMMAALSVFKQANAAGLGTEDCNAVYKITK
ncbi:NAD(P)-dependent oxidoreductase [Solidesulfovibrio sp. C21]|uniref:NAD(P)-dependent oxidoreductase n=1 Tax=Solidesulfovibrio sp. C21 TaxID=3398613 RepID=UPI0039FD54EC